MQPGAPAATAQSAKNKIVFGVAWEPLGFFPLRALDSASYYAQTLVFEGLVRYGDDKKIVPGLARQFTVAADGLTYTFDLRDGIRFSDGSPLTYADVAASIAVAQSKISPFRGDYECVERVECADGHHIILHLNAPSAPLLSRLVELRILPAKLLSQPDHGKSAMSTHPIGSGPFKLVRWESGLELVFEPNEFYWGARPQYQTLVWRVVPDKSLLAMAVERGELDVANIDATSWLFMGGDKAARDHDLILDRFRGSRTLYCGFNLRKKPFSDIRVREALCQAIDRETLVGKLFGGMALVPHTDAWPGSWSYNADTKSWAFDPEAAKKSLAHDGYALTKQGWQKDGQLLSLRILTLPDLRDLAQVVCDDLLRIEIPCEVQIMEYSSLRSRYLQKGDFDAIIWSRSSGPDPECSIVWGSAGAMNYSGFSNARVDELLKQGRKETTQAERVTTYGEVQAILAKELPWIFLAQPNLLIVHGADVQNIQRDNQAQTGLPWDNPLFNAANWKIVGKH
ncbi:MAG TPA: ABC transporter substrate-binding protein [Planktothrix sp.]|jgi:peptide/nickel transport system substrate-binding protein